MIVVHGVESVPRTATGAVLAIGNFDGVHRGHQALIAETVTTSRALGAPAGVIVFEPHPREFFHPEEPHFRLTSLPLKLKLLERFGIGVAVVLNFDAALAGMSAEAFIADILATRLAPRHVVIGYDFFFGRGRSGTPDTMRSAGDTYRFGVTVVSPVAEGGEVFSSSAIRLKLAQGDVTGAADALGNWWRVSGQVIGGAKRGTGLGFPTANVPMPKGTALAHGIYAVRVHAGVSTYDGAAYLGTRPTFDGGMPVLEVFLFDFGGDLYGQEIAVEFIGFIRPDRKFGTPEELVAQMASDCEAARGILAAAPQAY